MSFHFSKPGLFKTRTEINQNNARFSILEPNNWGGHEENSVEVFGADHDEEQGKWNDVYRWIVHSYVCEKPAQKFKARQSVLNFSFI